MKIIVGTTGHAEFEVTDERMCAALEEAARTGSEDEILDWIDTWRSGMEISETMTILDDEGRTLWSGAP